MTLDLTDDEGEVLANTIDRALQDLALEITHTDNPAFRRQLRERRDLLRGLRARLESSTSDRAG